MRRKIEYVKGTGYSNRIDYYEAFQENIENGILPKGLGQRYTIREATAFFGWEKNADELVFFFWDEIPTQEKIEAADYVAKRFGKKQAFFEICEVASGGEEYFLSFVFSIIVSWLAGKGIDKLIELVKNIDIKDNLSIIGKIDEINQVNGKMIISIQEIPEKGNVTIEICRCSDVISEVNEKCISELKNMIQNDGNVNYIYSKSGKKFIPKEFHGNISIDI